MSSTYQKRKREVQKDRGTSELTSLVDLLWRAPIFLDLTRNYLHGKLSKHAHLACISHPEDINNFSFAQSFWMRLQTTWVASAHCQWLWNHTIDMLLRSCSNSSLHFFSPPYNDVQINMMCLDTCLSVWLETVRWNGLIGYIYLSIDIIHQFNFTSATFLKTLYENSPPAHFLIYIITFFILWNDLLD